MFELRHGDCLDVLRTMADNSVDAIVTDPPYGLSFMGKRWDYDVPDEAVWRECLRVLKPGGHLLAFAGTRTQHRMAVRIEDAGFEIRDMIAWIYGSGFPKSLDVSKAIDKAAGVEREVVGRNKHGRTQSVGAYNFGGRDVVNGSNNMGQEFNITAPATDAAKTWHGWGTALKPALEPITVARKPFNGTVANNLLTWGTGALNIDGCRVGLELLSAMTAGQAKIGTFERGVMVTPERTGRFPANLIHDGSEEVVGLFPVTGPAKAGGKSGADPGMWAGKKQSDRGGHDDAGGSAARFFYCAKASKRDRDEGCEGMEVQHVTCRPESDDTEHMGLQERLHGRKARNHHPTVKPTDLMRYLCRLVTPPNGTVLDPFMGSGSTGKAAMLEGFDFIGIEREAEYLDIARARIQRAADKAPLFTGQP